MFEVHVDTTSPLELEPTARSLSCTVFWGASHMSEQRRWFVDAFVLAVPAEYAGASSRSGDHPQQYYLHRPKLTTFEEKDLFRFC